MKVLYLFNKVIGSSIEDVEKGSSHDSWLFGMLRLRKHGLETNFLELEKYIPKKLATFLRKNILTMHYAHIPLFPLFFRYDLVFTSTAYGSLFLKALFRIKKFKWVILDFNLLGTIKKRKTFKEKLFYWSIKHGADGIVAISQAEADALKSTLPDLRDRIVFLHEPTDTNFFRPIPSEEKNQIISVGNYGRDFETVIEATKDLEVDLFIAGKFSDRKKKSLPVNVKIGQLNHLEMRKEYSESKIVVISLKTNKEYFDSIGTLSLGEAMAMGKSVIVTYTKNMESYIEDHVNGVFVEEGNVEETKSAIVGILDNSEKRRSLGENARDFAVEKLDADLFSQQLAFFLKSMV